MHQSENRKGGYYWDGEFKLQMVEKVREIAMWMSEKRILQAEGTANIKGPEVGAWLTIQRTEGQCGWTE